MIGHVNLWRIPGVWMLSVALAIAAVSNAEAQLQTGNLYGTVVNEEGAPLPGVTVTITGSQGMPRVQVTDSRGNFGFRSLPPGSYEAKAELEGFSTVAYPSLRVRVGADSYVEITQPPSTGDVITVMPHSPLLDERQLSPGTAVDRGELEQTPVARDPWAILQSHPGVLTDRINIGGSESGHDSSYVSIGSTVQQNTWAVDGVQITDMAALGTSPSYYDFDSFEEMQVTTGGADATVATGGVVLNMVTKRGTNEWRGSGRYYLSDEGFNGDWSDDFHNQPGLDFQQGGRTTSVNDYAAELGGPIIKDRLWIWGSYGTQQIDRETISDADWFTELSTAHAKINAQISPANLTTFLVLNSDKNANWIGRDPARRLQDTTWNTDRFGDTVVKIEDTHIFSSNFYLTGLYSRVNGGFDFVPDGGANRIATFSEADGAWHNTFNLYQTDRKQEQFKADASSFFNTGSLSHELKFGAGYRNAEVSELEHWPGYAVNLDDVSFAVSDSHRTTHAGYTGVYAQDTLLLGNLTINVGIRYDQQDGSWEGSRDRHPTFSNFLPGVTFDERDLDFDWTSITPRLGLTYAIGHTNDTIVRLNYGQYAHVLAPNKIAFIQPVGMGLFSGSPAFQNGALLGFIPPLQDTAGAQLPQGVFDKNVDVPLQTDLLFGVEHALLPDFVVGLNLTYRSITDQLTNTPFVIDGNAERPATGNDYELFAPFSINIGGQTFTENVYSIRNSLVRTDRDFVTNGDARTESKQASLTFNKRLANRWMLRGNFTWADWNWDVSEQAQADQDPTRILQQPRDSDPRTERSFDASSRDVYLGAGWSYSINGLYQIAPDRPWGFNAALNLNGRQGSFDQPFRSINRPDGTTATVRFGDEFRLENQHFMDAGVQKEFTFSDFGLSLGVDVFNVLNKSYVNQRNGDLDQGRFVTEITSPRVLRLGARLSFR